MEIIYDGIQLFINLYNCLLIFFVLFNGVIYYFVIDFVVKCGIRFIFSLKIYCELLGG